MSSRFKLNKQRRIFLVVRVTMQVIMKLMLIELKCIFVISEALRDMSTKIRLDIIMFNLLLKFVGV